MVPLIVDGHLDLAMNAIEWNRDITQSLASVRERESGMTDKVDRGNGVVTLPEMRRGRIGICVATFIARHSFVGHPCPGWHSTDIAWSIVSAQQAWYESLEARGELRVIRSRADLAASVDQWRTSDEPARLPIGIVQSLEGADSLESLSRLERLVESGLRAVGPAHYGPGVFSPGTGSTGGLTARGRELLVEMQRLGVTLDVTHLTDEAFWEALDLFEGQVWASHSNCRALVPDQRQLDDQQIRELAQRGAVIGAAFDAWMLVPGWQRGTTRPDETGVRLTHVVDQIDYVCQLLGTARHSVIGSDLDGGFGREQAPLDLESIADLQKLDAILESRGYAKSDRELIFSGNWLRSLEKTLPD